MTAHAHFATKPKTLLTTHQMNVLRIVIAGNDSPDPNLALADLDEILERIDRKTNKPSLQFTIRSLQVNGMITKEPQQRRRGRLRAVFKATVLGLHIAGAAPTPVSPIVEPFLDPDLASLLPG